MKGFRITLANLDTVEVDDAAAYVVTDDGTLALTANGAVVRRLDAGEWVEVEEMGTRLAISWPPADLPWLLEELAVLLGLRWGHYVHNLPTADDLSSELLNDEDRLIHALFTAVDASLDNKELIGEASDIIRRWVALRGDGPARQP